MTTAPKKPAEKKPARSTPPAAPATGAALLATGKPRNRPDRSTKLDRKVEALFANVKHEHDEQSARRLIRYFNFVLARDGLFSTGGQLNVVERTFLEFISYGFGRYVDGKSLDVAFRLRRTRGQRKVLDSDLALRNFGIAMKVESGIRVEMKARKITRSAVKIEIICGEVAKELGMGCSTVSNIYRDFKDFMESLELSDDELAQKFI
jgi:hypothetical protein